MLLDQVSLIRIACFAGVLLAMLLWQALAPRRPTKLSRPWRWSSNLGLVVIDTVVVRLLIPLGAMGTAVFGTEHGWGLLNLADVSPWVNIVVSVIVLDLVIYAQHVVFHRVPWLWRLHMVHHADLEFDTTTGVRFHPLEILISMGIKMAAVALLGASWLGVLIFEVLLNATSLFNHGNVRLPAVLDRVLRLLLVTPEMHRVHHSVIRSETNSNFGFNLPWWDRLFGTYRDEPAEGHLGMTIGLHQFREEAEVERLHRLLALPFTGSTGDYPRQPKDPARTEDVASPPR
jgi:sterol desaturase/sphingolipid hydroxylase (fatty acid hydroxylase superfamily)